MRNCLLCGQPLPPLRWWDRVLGKPPPFHDSEGPDGEVCWRLLNRRLGITDPGPKPSKKGWWP